MCDWSAEVATNAPILCAVLLVGGFLEKMAPLTVAQLLRERARWPATHCGLCIAAQYIAQGVDAMPVGAGLSGTSWSTFRVESGEPLTRD